MFYSGRTTRRRALRSIILPVETADLACIAIVRMATALWSGPA